MNLRLRAYDLILETLVCISLTLIVSHARAQDEFDFELPAVAPAVTPPATEEEVPLVEDHRSNAGLVELHVPLDYSASYKERRGTHGFLFGVNYTNIMFKDYISLIDNTTPYTDLFGETEFPLVELDLSYKLNFTLGSLTADFGYGFGSISDDPLGVEGELSVTKISLSGSYIMDNLFSEPYVAPYGTFGVMRLSLSESSPTESVHGNIDMLYFYKFGVLLQLDWLDPTFSKKVRGDYGLENTYIDLFISKFEPSSDEFDPSTETDFSYGAGLRLEF